MTQNSVKSLSIPGAKYMIPKFIHQLWIDPESPTKVSQLPQDILPNVHSWRIHHKGWIHRLWSLPEIYKLCKDNSRYEVERAIRACRFPSMQADIARLLVLEQLGGIWVDLKLYDLCPFIQSLSEYELVLTEHFPKHDLPDPTGHISNSFIGSIPENAILRTALHTSVDNVNRRMKGSIYHVTGATNIMNAVQDIRDPEKFYLINHKEAWNNFFEIRGGSYNKNNMHWSLREGREYPYVD